MSPENRNAARRRALLLPALLLLILSCSSDASDPAEATSLGSSATTDGSGGGDTLGGMATCQPGDPGCPCASEMCLEPLVCSEGVCVWPPPSGSDDTGMTPPGTSGGTEGTSCSGSSDCEWYEVCGVDDACVFATDPAYEIRVPSWVPTSCDGGPLDGVADLFWRLTVEGVQPFESSWVQGGCPGSWAPTQVACLPAGSLEGAFILSLYDEDADGEELHDRLWWDGDGDGVADPIPVDYLNAGVYDDVTGNGGQVRVEFTVVGGCR